MQIAYVDQGYSGDIAAERASRHGIELFVVKLEEVKRGFVLLPKQWVVKRSFAWATRFHRLVKDYERLPETVAGMHLMAFACIMLKQCFSLIQLLQSAQHPLGSVHLFHSQQSAEKTVKS